MSDKEKLNKLMKDGWSYRENSTKVSLTDEDKEELAKRVTNSLGANIVDDVCVLGRVEVSE